ncbi:DNA mismatch repair endonuclease MutL [Acidiluteibacter ferrifornacis]|uniref:DNA mismatch repair protein MutL n=1 Tax=Acidiluteibacter ferrifornacis TaxID=2692424 RepID=A0A6N9NFL3_9FLAO|nr:DNA mismatch repair endonuclease MutL [Acidiluteibacter ferrifornacis]NBG65436.1 DNA mismatch repair endonuclease MutL [Acidiluteibacter ferrifornacis]
MSDIIQLLPDSVANQIAAGEVVQRPASAVKELLENAIDAGATDLCLIIKNAGKTLIQVIDNGKGMSPTDARMAFERHATSKIKSASDLFALRTMGFRGEALASIAAISQVELKTKQADQDLGTCIVIEGSVVDSQEACSTQSGTNLSVKNLFFNVPARRNFLKSNPVETKHIIEEFYRVAMVHPEISFQFHSEGNELFNLPKGSFRQRIVSIFGDKYNQRLVPVEEETDIVSISGFVGKPEYAKKTRGEQYFFVNERFIKSPYLNHAIQIAFDELITKDQHPSYFLKLEIDPARIDINIHPTKTEIKFEDERSIYAIIRTSVKQALGKYNIAPSLDFEQESSFNASLRAPDQIKVPTIEVNPNFNPFETTSKPPRPSTGSDSFSAQRQRIDTNWQQLYSQEDFEKDSPTHTTIEPEENTTILAKWDETPVQHNHKMVQLHQRYIITQIKSGAVIIDQQRAHERILYERFIKALNEKKHASQRLLFPETIEFSPDDYAMMVGLVDEINQLGFEINEFGKNTFVVNAVPVELTENNLKGLLEKLLDQFKLNSDDLRLDKRESLARSLAHNTAIKRGKLLHEDEMQNLIDELFSCEMPNNLPNGKPIVITYSIDELDKRFQRT